MNTVSPIPEGFSAVTPHLVVRNAAEAIEFYRKAFGAEETSRIAAPDGHSVLHAELKIDGAPLFLCDEMPGCSAPPTVGGTSCTLHIYCADVDARFEQAVKAGAKAVMSPTDMFWGDRYGKVLDPFGHSWSLASRIQILSPEEVAAAAQQAFSQS